MSVLCLILTNVQYTVTLMLQYPHCYVTIIVLFINHCVYNGYIVLNDSFILYYISIYDLQFLVFFTVSPSFL